MNGSSWTLNGLLTKILSFFILISQTKLFFTFLYKTRNWLWFNKFGFIGHLTEVLIENIFLQFFHMIIMNLFDFLIYFLWEINELIECNRNTNHFLICNDVFKFVNMLIIGRKYHFHSYTFILTELDKRSIIMRFFVTGFERWIICLSLINNFFKAHHALTWVNDKNLIFQFDPLSIIVSFKNDIFIKVNFVETIRWNVEKTTEIRF